MPNYLVICSPVAEMRQHPSVQSAVVSQALFSEEVREISRTADWIQIQTKVDDYVGWIEAKALCERNTPFAAKEPVAVVKQRAAHLYPVQDTIYGPSMTLPFESRLEILDTNLDTEGRWLQVGTPDQRQVFIQRGDVRINPAILSPPEMSRLALFFLHLPYTWGGRSSFGYDCSGFVQMLYRQIGILLPRDAKDQMSSFHLAPVPVKDLQQCDLLFFGNHASEIRHVGMCLSSEQFIHATVAENMPIIRINSLTDVEWSGAGKYRY